MTSRPARVTLYAVCPGAVITHLVSVSTNHRYTPYMYFRSPSQSLAHDRNLSRFYQVRTGCDAHITVVLMALQLRSPGLGAVLVRFCV